jgi:hypothetical protein
MVPLATLRKTKGQLREERRLRAQAEAERDQLKATLGHVLDGVRNGAKSGNRRPPPARTNGHMPASVDLRGAGRVQRRVWRAFVTFPDAELMTAQLAAFCYPRLDGEPLRKHRWAIVRAAQRVAMRVRRDRPGGVVFRAKVD